MKTILVNVLFLILLSCTQASTQNNSTRKHTDFSKVPVLESDTTFTFDASEIASLPIGWTSFYTGRNGKVTWQIQNDNGNKVLAQLASSNPNYHFNGIVFDGFKTKNVELEVRMKGVTGREDQGGGFVWRYQDPNNYYVVRANPLEDNMVLYKVENGKRTDLPLLGKGKTYGVDVKPLGNDWNTMKLIVKDNLFVIYLNGQKLFSVKDETFKEAGKVGLWTKADAVSYFDDYQVVPL